MNSLYFRVRIGLVTGHRLDRIYSMPFGTLACRGAIQVKIAQIGHFFLLARQVDALRKNKIPSWAILILNGGSSGLGENQRIWFARRRRRIKIPD